VEILTTAFLVIGKYMAWKVGNGAQVRIGSDAIIGCGEDIFLPATIVLHLQELDKCTLNKVDKPQDTTIWSQGWLSDQDLKLEMKWGRYGNLLLQTSSKKGIKKRRFGVTCANVMKKQIPIFL
jgi:hypothetical protein